MHAAGIIPSMNSTIKHSKPCLQSSIWKYSIFLHINEFDNRRDISMYTDYIRIYLFKSGIVQIILFPSFIGNYSTQKSLSLKNERKLETKIIFNEKIHSCIWNNSISTSLYSRCKIILQILLCFKKVITHITGINFVK